MVKYTQTIRRITANELFECVWPFCVTGADKVNNQKRIELRLLFNIFLVLRNLEVEN